MVIRFLLSTALILVFWAPYIFWKSTWYGFDLTANLFAGAIDIVITLLGIDTILKISDKRKLKPIRFAVYREAGLVLQRIVSIWIEMSKVSCDNREYLAGEIFSEANIENIGHHFDLSANPNHPQYPTWPFRIQIATQEINSRINQIFTRYNQNIDVELFSCLQDIEAMPTLLAMSLSNIIYTNSDFGTSETRRRFPIVENFVKTDKIIIERLRCILIRQAKEFSDMGGFHEPRELLFTEVDIRNDIWPSIGSAYR